MSDLVTDLSRRPADFPTPYARAYFDPQVVAAVEAYAGVPELQAHRDSQHEGVEVARSQVDAHRAVLERCDAELRRLAEEIAHVERILPATCAAVLLGQSPETAEAALLERLERARRLHRRHELARPTLEAMLKQARSVHAPLASELNETELRLAKAREVARRKLAAAAVGRG